MILASNLKILRNFSTNEKQNTSYLVRVIFPALFSELKVISMNSDWFIELFVSVVIGPSYYLGFGFSTVKRAPTVVLPRIHDVG